MKHTWTWVALAVAAALPLGAQEKTEPSPKPSNPAVETPLKVQLVMSKFQGEKKVSSLPYTLTCNADDKGGSYQLRMGIEVPIPMVQTREGVAVTSFQYRNAGTNIDCRAWSLDDGRFRVELTVEISSVYSPIEEKVRGASARDAGEAAGTGEGPAPPVFRTFKSNFRPLLRDGQTVQYTAATDPVSGEVVKIDVSLAVMR